MTDFVVEHWQVATIVAGIGVLVVLFAIDRRLGKIVDELAAIRKLLELTNRRDDDGPRPRG